MPGFCSYSTERRVYIRPKSFEFFTVIHRYPRQLLALACNAFAWHGKPLVRTISASFPITIIIITTTTI